MHNILRPQNSLSKFGLIVLDAPSQIKPPQISAYTLYF